MTTSRQATDAAELSNAIYTGGDGFRQKAASMGYDPQSITLIRDERGDVKAAVVSKGGETTVVFRGTKDWQDAKADLDFAKTAVPGANFQVHKGFREDLHSHKDAAGKDMLAQIEAAIPAGSKVTFTGHSLGGGLANLAAMEHNGASELITFGAPRVGDAAFAAALEEKLGRDRITRVVASGDAVTQIPPSARVVGAEAGFEHAGNPQAMDRQGRLQPPTREQPLQDLIVTAMTIAVRDPSVLKSVLSLKSSELGAEQKVGIVKDIVVKLVQNTRSNHSMNTYLQSPNAPSVPVQEDARMQALAASAQPNLGQARLTESSPAGTAVASARDGARPSQAGTRPGNSQEQSL